MSNCKVQPEQVRLTIKDRYSYLQDEEIKAMYDIALGDYLRYKFPSVNSKHIVESFELDFISSQWLVSRMIDILGRAGGLSVDAYRENGLNLSYGASYIDPNLVSQITPRAGVPR